SDADGITWFQVGLGVRHQESLANPFHNLIPHRRRLEPETNDPAHTPRRPDRRPVVLHTIEMDEEIAREEGLSGEKLAVFAATLHRTRRPVALEALALQVLQRPVVFLRLAMDQIPAGLLSHSNERASGGEKRIPLTSPWCRTPEGRGHSGSPHSYICEI